MARESTRFNAHIDRQRSPPHGRQPSRQRSDTLAQFDTNTMLPAHHPTGYLATSTAIAATYDYLCLHTTQVMFSFLQHWAARGPREHAVKRPYNKGVMYQYTHFLFCPTDLKTYFFLLQLSVLVFFRNSQYYDGSPSINISGPSRECQIILHDHIEPRYTTRKRFIPTNKIGNPTLGV